MKSRIPPLFQVIQSKWDVWWCANPGSYARNSGRSLHLKKALALSLSLTRQHPLTLNAAVAAHCSLILDAPPAGPHSSILSRLLHPARCSCYIPRRSFGIPSVFSTLSSTAHSTQHNTAHLTAQHRTAQNRTAVGVRAPAIRWRIPRSAHSGHPHSACSFFAFASSSLITALPPVCPRCPLFWAVPHCPLFWACPHCVRFSAPIYAHYSLLDIPRTLFC